MSAFRSPRPSPRPGRRVLLVDVQPHVVDALNRGESHIEDVSSERLEAARREGRVVATTDYEQVKQAQRGADRAADAALAPARARPLATSRRRAEPRAGAAARARSSCSSRRPSRARHARCCSRSSRRARGLKAGEDFHLAMSPERVDPGREDWTTKTTPKVVGGINAASTRGGRRRLPRARSTRCTRCRRRTRPS